MIRQSILVTVAFCFILLPSAFADFPVRQSPNKETAPAVAYNSTNHEYLAVWTEEFMFGGSVVTSVKGQRVAEDGSMLGDSFTIAPFVAYPTIAYNAHVNEYVVAGTNYGNIVGQRISSSGALVGSQATLMPGASKARVVCNSITGEYLVVGVIQTSSPSGANLQFYSSNVSADLQTVSPPQLLRSWTSSTVIAEDVDIAVAFAQIQTTETPAGRYLLVLGPGVEVRMLDSEGAVVNVGYDSQTGLRYPELPFTRGPHEGGEVNVDVAFGSGQLEGFTGPAFLVVWSDKYNEWGSDPWSGIWGGYVDAAKLEYLASDPRYDRAFPISSVAYHEKTDSLVAQWRPQVTYNPLSQKFFTVWRETPKDLWNAKTRKTHIRGSNGLGAAAGTNVVISDTVGFENPKYPAIAASTTSENALIIWQDSRDSVITKADIFGDVQKVGDAIITPSTGTTVTNTNDQGPGSLRQAILNANATAGVDTITFNIPGNGPHTILPATPLPILTDPVVIDGYTQPGSSPNTNEMTEPDNAVHKIVIDGTAVPSVGILVDGLCLRGGNSVVRGLVINSFTGSGLVCEENGGNTIEGNFIGTDVTGIMARSCFNDIDIRNVPDNLIGGITPSARNTISGFQGYATFPGAGIRIEHAGATRNQIRGNFIGLASDGNSAPANYGHGVYILNAPGNTVGGLQQRMRNVISGVVANAIDGGGGVYMYGDSAYGNVVIGNFTGTNASGTAIVKNSVGIYVGSPSATIGGTHPGAGNLISGSQYVGLSLQGDDAIVEGNYIGTDFTGTRSLGNRVGLLIGSVADFTIGGPETGSGNVVSGNTWCGVRIDCGGAPCSGVLQGNFIGVQADGESALANRGPGVLCEGGHSGIVIGGREHSAGNTIAFNESEGVLVRHKEFWEYPNPTGVRISGNSIFSNKRIGINLAGGSEDAHGITANDPVDADSGNNMLQNSPVITSATGGGFLSVGAHLNSTPNTQFDIEVFASPSGSPPVPGEGKVFLGHTSVTTNAAGDVSFSMTIGTSVYWDQFITMTATDPAGNTSEFSAPCPVGMSGATETVTTTADTGAGSFRRAIELTNAYPGPNVIAFNIPGTGPHAIRPASPLPVITDTLLIDGYTQPGSKANTNTIADGSNAVLKIEIDGSNAGVDVPGLVVAASRSIVRGLAVNRFGNAGIGLLGDSNYVTGCFIGTDVNGTSRLGNSAGVVVTGHVHTNCIGGLSPDHRNLISGNSAAGIIVDGGAELTDVLGNLIGTDATGKSSLGNIVAGVAFIDGYFMRVGCNSAEGRNIISGCGNDGQNGAPAVRGAGVFVAERGLACFVFGAIIGLNAEGTAVLQNFMDGILSRAACAVGATDDGALSIISGNAFTGVRIEGGSPYINNDLLLDETYIGTDATGKVPLSNHEGITVCYGARASIGEGSVIAYNLVDGIDVLDSAHAQISQSSIFSNGGLGINLVGGVEDSKGRTMNDPGDIDDGPSDLLNHPEIFAAEGGENLKITGRLQSEPYRSFKIEFYVSPAGDDYGVGRDYVGMVHVQTDAAGLAPFAVILGRPVAAGQRVTAIASIRDSVWASSEFSDAVVATVATSVGETESVPQETTLQQNYPNPFNPTTTVRYSVEGVVAPSGAFSSRVEGPDASRVRLAVYDLLGREVAVLVDEQKEPGYYTVTWDAGRMASGVYYSRLQVGDKTMMKKMLLLK